MNAEWEETTWGKLATLEYGKRLSDYEEAEGPYPVYGTNGPIGWHSEPLCDHPGVIVGRKGAYRGVHYSEKPFYVIDTAFYLEPQIEMDIRWAYYQICGYDINSMDSGSAIPSTSRDRFYGLPVRVPPLPQQRRIADVLGALDDKIALNRRMNETLEAMAQALYRYWFVDFRPFQDGTFTESELGPIPQGWYLEPLDEVAGFLNGTAWKRYAVEGDEESLPVLKIRELRGGFDEKSDRASKERLPEKYNIGDGDVIFSWSGSLLLRKWSGGPGALNQHLFKVTSERFPRWFFYQWIRSYIEYFRRIAESKATTMGHIKRSHLSESLVAVPPPETLDWMNETMAPIMQRQYANDLEARKLAETRDYLLPKLVSGEVEVSEAELDAVAA